MREHIQTNSLSVSIQKSKVERAFVSVNSSALGISASSPAALSKSGQLAVGTLRELARARDFQERYLGPYMAALIIEYICGQRTVPLQCRLWVAAVVLSDSSSPPFTAGNYPLNSCSGRTKRTAVERLLYTCCPCSCCTLWLRSLPACVTS